MTPGLDLADVIAVAEATDGKVILAGDIGQLQAVQNGGGMSLLAGQLGYVQLTEPVRFTAGWERAASLRLRNGDTAVLAAYDQHARIRGGDPERTMDAAATAYVALTAAGTDALLMAAGHALRKELSRRIRDDLLRLGLVRTRTSRNHRRRPASQPRRPDHLHPQRPHRQGRRARPHARQRRPAPHRRRHPKRACWYDEPRRRPGNRAAPLDRPPVPVRQVQRLRTRLRRHRAHRPGPHRAHRPRRHHRHRGPPARLRRPHPRHRHQHGLRVHHVAETRRPRPRPAPRPRTRPPRPPHHRPGNRHRPGSPRSSDRRRARRPGRRAGTRRRATVRHPDLAAGPLRRRPPGDPERDLDRRDHPRPPPALPRPVPGRPPPELPARTRPPGEMALADPARRRTGRPGPRRRPGGSSRGAGPDRRPRHPQRHRRPPPPPARSTHPAPGRPLVRAAPRHPRPRTPRLHRPDRHADGRSARNASASTPPPAPSPGQSPPWDQSPTTEPDRLEWQRRASSIGAYRELSGHDHPTDPIGPEPVTGTPDLRAAWHEALAALGPADGPDVRGMPDGCCSTCATPTRPKPPGHPSGPATSSARPAPEHGKPAWPPSAPPPKPPPPAARATALRPPGSGTWPPATRPCTRPTSNARPRFADAMADRDDWEEPPASSGNSPSPPTPNCAAATPASPTRHCARPNPSPATHDQPDQPTRRRR